MIPVNPLSEPFLVLNLMIPGNPLSEPFLVLNRIYVINFLLKMADLIHPMKSVNLFWFFLLNHSI